MIKFRLYRWLRVLFGARSFVKDTEPTKTWVIVSGNTIKTAKVMTEKLGFKEEWTKSWYQRLVSDKEI